MGVAANTGAAAVAAVAGVIRATNLVYRDLVRRMDRGRTGGDGATNQRAARACLPSFLPSFSHSLYLVRWRCQGDFDAC